MMFGTLREFTYLECNSCGCLQLMNIPIDLSAYYPDDYYALNTNEESRLKKFLKKQRGLSALGKPNVIGSLLLNIWGVPDIVEWIKNLDIQFDTSILDIGSGKGEQLDQLYNLGFRDLTGIDPFIESDLYVADGYRIYKKQLLDLKRKHGFIMCNHALEHMPDQFYALYQMHRLLDEDGTLLIRIPLSGTYAWRTYKTEWVQLDAPRHLFIHTIESFQILAKQTGFEIKDIIFDSTEFQFTGSERYRSGVSLMSDQKNLPSDKRLKEFKNKAKELNKLHDGDQACFYLKKTLSD